MKLTIWLVGAGHLSVFAHRGPTSGLLLLQCFRAVADEVSQRVVTGESSSLPSHSLFINFKCCP